MIARVQRRVSAGGNYFAQPKTDLQFIKSGSKTLDLALGGGWVRARILNVVGDKSTGKTLLCIEACANFIAEIPHASIKYREAESAFDKLYAAALGMPVDQVDFGNPLETVEDLFEDLERVADKAKVPTLYICDSLDSLSDRAELARNMDTATYGQEKAKKLSQMFRRLVRKLADADVTVLIVSQVRSKIDAVKFGRKTTRTGGRALDFYASQVVYLSQIGKIKRKASGVIRPVGVMIRAQVEKNKVGLPFREADFSIKFGFGIDDVLSCLEFLKLTGRVGDVVPRDCKDLKEYSREMLTWDLDEYGEAVTRIHDAVAQRWYQIEEQFLPPRKKYG